MRHAWVLAVAVAVAACGRSSSDRSKQAARDGAVGAASDATAVGDAAAPTTFEGLADAVARRSARKVVASGEAKLAEDGQPRKWATLEAEDLNAGRGAYVIEAAPGRWWLVSFASDGRTIVWRGSPGDTAIEHAQGHHHGGETVTFALRGGEPVVLSYEYVEDAADEDSRPVHQEFAKNGSCAAGCPPLRSFPHQDSDLQVVGPAASLDELLVTPK